jgi:hypothetical protein
MSKDTGGDNLLIVGLDFFTHCVIIYIFPFIHSFTIILQLIFWNIWLLTLDESCNQMLLG